MNLDGPPVLRLRTKKDDVVGVILCFLFIVGVAAYFVAFAVEMHNALPRENHDADLSPVVADG